MGRIITEELIVREEERLTAATGASTDEKTLFELRLRDRPLKEDELTKRRGMRFAGFNGKPAVVIRFRGIQFSHHQFRRAIVERASKRIVRALSCTRKSIFYKALQRMKEDESR
jgi:hypothetical protein